MSKMNEILAIVTANSEENVDDFLALLAPDASTKEELQQTFEDTIGYDPTSYFDKKVLKEKIDDLMDDSIPDEVSEYLSSDTERVIDDAYDKFDENRSEYLDDALSETVYENTGWSPEEEDDGDDAEDIDDTDEDD